MTASRHLVGLLIFVAAGAHGEDSVRAMKIQGDWLQAICRAPDNWPSPPGQAWEEQAPDVVRFRGREIGDRRQWREPGGARLRIDRLRPADRPGRWILEKHDASGQPSHFLGLDDQCRLRAVRRLVHAAGRPVSLQVFDGNYEPLAEEPLNPDPPESTAVAPPGRIAVAMVDAGVNYLLPEIVDGLARGSDGRPLGYDFWDMDVTPFDTHFAASPFFVTRHGTRTASLMLAEAPEAMLVSYRYPRPDMDRMADLVRHAAGLGIRIMGLPLGSNRPEDWVAFERAARHQPEMLFIASAGNDGRDIDREPVYPAALDLPNLLVVSSSDDSLRPARGSNYGAGAVDILLPAERVQALDFDGGPRAVSGSSYAVSRLVALAVRLLARNPSLDTSALIDAVRARAIPPLFPSDAALGVIPDPVADRADIRWRHIDPATDREAAPEGRIALRVLLLDPAWEPDVVDAALAAATELLEQCDLSFRVTDRLVFAGSDYLKDLASGAARTLFGSLPVAGEDTVNLVFARDSRLPEVYEGQAFGQANSGSRPWLRNSAWILPESHHLSLVIAHELFHVLANDGSHAPGDSNLMSAETGPAKTRLTNAQCALARAFGNRTSS